MHTNFLLGTVQVTETARKKLGRDPLDLVARHAVNEHGLISQRERTQNRVAMKTVDRIVSRYWVDPTNPNQGFVEVITDEHWETTTVKLKDE